MTPLHLPNATALPNGLACAPISPPYYPARPVNGGPWPQALAVSGTWWYEPKYNGWRALVHIPTRSMFNRQLNPLSITHEFAAALDALSSLVAGHPEAEWLDCEALDRRHQLGKGTLIVLDCPGLLLDYHARRAWLRALLPEHNWWRPPGAGKVYLTPASENASASRNTDTWWADLQTANRDWGVEFYEGLVGKRCDSIYPRQRRSANLEFTYWKKHRWAY